MTLEQEIKDHKAPIEPACEFDPDCENCPYPERRDKWWRLFLSFATTGQIEKMVEQFNEEDLLKDQLTGQEEE